MKNIVRLLVALVAAVLGFAPTTTGTAERFTYDAPTIARFDVPPVEVARSGQTSLSDVREEYASISVEAHGTSTTPARSLVATNTADKQITKATSPVWQSFEPFRGSIKTNGLTGSKKEFYMWDYTHGDIEVYDKNGKHKGTMDPKTGEMTKPAVPGRKIKV